MRKLAILTFITLDGVMQAPAMPEEDETGNFQHGGWAAPYWEEVMQQVQIEAMAEPYDILMGRKTYDLFASHFSQTDAGDLEARKFNDARKFVVTRSSEGLDWENTTQLDGEPALEVARIKAQSGPLLQVHGSWRLIQALLAGNLVDEFRLWTFPVVVGSGKRLFDDPALPISLALMKSGKTPNGVTMSFYRCQTA